MTWVINTLPENPARWTWSLFHKHFVGYRPIEALSFALNSALSTDPFAYRIVDSLIAATAAATVGLIAYRASRSLLALLPGLLFTLHPTMVEVTARLSRRSYSLSIAFSALAIAALQRGAWRVASVLVALAALSNETAYPLAVGAAAFALAKEGPRAAAVVVAGPTLAMVARTAALGGKFGGYKVYSITRLFEPIQYLDEPDRLASLSAALDTVLSGTLAPLLWLLVPAIFLRGPARFGWVAWVATQWAMTAYVGLWFPRQGQAMVFAGVIGWAALIGQDRRWALGMVVALLAVAPNADRRHRQAIQVAEVTPQGATVYRSMIQVETPPGEVGLLLPNISSKSAAFWLTVNTPQTSFSRLATAPDPSTAIVDGPKGPKYGPSVKRKDQRSLKRKLRDLAGVMVWGDPPVLLLGEGPPLGVTPSRLELIQSWNLSPTRKRKKDKAQNQ